jgi:hypothetical protein
VLPLQSRVDSHKDVVYRSVEGIRRDIMALQPKHLIAQLLIDVSSSDSPEDRRQILDVGRKTLTPQDTQRWMLTACEALGGAS